MEAGLSLTSGRRPGHLSREERDRGTSNNADTPVTVASIWLLSDVYPMQRQLGYRNLPCGALLYNVRGTAHSNARKTEYNKGVSTSDFVFRQSSSHWMKALVARPGLESPIFDIMEPWYANNRQE